LFPPAGVDAPGHELDAVGDVDGDGRPDFVVRGEARSGDQGYLLLYRGGALPLDAPVQVPMDNLKVVAAGDVDGDGYADLLANDEGPILLSSVHLHRGGPDGPSSRPHQSFGLHQDTDDLGTFGRTIAPAGDVNGDGFDDILIGSRSAAHLVPGSSNGLLVCRAVELLLDPEAFDNAPSVASAGDVDGDGLDDVLVAASSYLRASEGVVHVYTDLGDIPTEPCPELCLDTADTGLEIDTADTAPSTDDTQATDSDPDEARDCGCSTSAAPSPLVAWLVTGTSVMLRRRRTQR
jgi:uncharacterized protein (TIGR03382 family)